MAKHQERNVEEPTVASKIPSEKGLPEARRSPISHEGVKPIGPDTLFDDHGRGLFG